MKLQLVRNATMKINYNGVNILTDPMFAKKGTMPPFAFKGLNPTVNLTMNISEITNGTELLLTSHYHPDHFDKTAKKILDKSIPLICPSHEGEKYSSFGFESVISVDSETTFNGIKITRVNGQHGTGTALKLMGKTSGYILSTQGEPTVYWIGDSILTEEVKENIKKFNPDVIITHSGGAKLPFFPPILMNGIDTVEVAKLAPNAKVVAVHMESLDHCGVKRADLKELATKDSLNNIVIPKDGETINL